MAPESEGQPYYRCPELTLGEAERILAHAVRDFLEQVKQRPENEEKMKKQLKDRLSIRIDTYPVHRLQIAAPAGIGKTRAVAEGLADFKGVVWYLVPDKGLMKEVVETLEAFTQGTIIPVTGRSHSNCKRYKQTVIAGEKGVSIQKTFCDNGVEQCPHYAGCPYQAMLQSLREGSANGNDLESGDDEDKGLTVYVMAHNYMTVPIMKGQPDAVIVDEKSWPAFVNIFEIPIADLLAAGDENIAGFGAYKEATETVIQAIRANPTGFLLNLRKAGNVPLLAAIGHIKAVIKDRKGLKASPGMEVEEIASAVDGWQRPKLNRIRYFLYRLNAELREPKLISAVSLTYSSLTDAIKVHSLKNTIISRRTPVLLIDASADLELNRLVWGNMLLAVELRVERNSYVIQVGRKVFSYQSLGVPRYESREQETLRKEVIQFINWVADQNGEPILLAAPKKVLRVLKPHLNENVHTAHFGKLRGLNKHKDCNVCIILSREQPRAKDVEDRARALLSRSNRNFNGGLEYSKLPRNRRLRGNKVEEVLVDIHPDDIAQRVLEQSRERESEQAIDRIRSIRAKEPKTIFILCDVPLDITVDQTLRWQDLKRGGTKFDRALKKVDGKAFPLSASEMRRMFPDIWETEDQAKGDIRRNGGVKGVETLIRLYKENDPFYSVEYRISENQKKWSRALIAAPQDNPRAALESLIGPVKSFNILKLLCPISQELADNHGETEMEDEGGADAE